MCMKSPSLHQMQWCTQHHIEVWNHEKILCTNVCTLLYHVSRHALDVQVHQEIYQAVLQLNDKCQIKDWV